MIFAAFNGAACVHMFLFAHETAGLTLEEMDELFDSGRPAVSDTVVYALSLSLFSLTILMERTCC